MFTLVRKTGIKIAQRCLEDTCLHSVACLAHGQHSAALDVQWSIDTCLQGRVSFHGLKNKGLCSSRR